MGPAVIERSELERFEEVLGGSFGFGTEGETDADVYIEVPDDIRGIALYGIAKAIDQNKLSEIDLRQTRAHLQMASNLITYVQDEEARVEASELFDHQSDTVRKTLDFLLHPETDASGNFIRKGYIELPTGTGKTAIFTRLLDVINKNPKDPQKKLKSLVLVSRLDQVDQTRGDRGAKKRGFARFASRTSVSEYHKDVKDLSGDAVIMTYRSFNRLVQPNKLPPDMFDIVICDEAHNVLGEQTRDSIERYTQDKLTIGLTATPEYGGNKHICDVMPTEIHSMGLKEAVYDGLLSPLQVLAVATNEEIPVVNRFGDYTDDELAGLIEHEWRNQKAVEFAAAFIEGGTQGVISCVPGRDCEHALRLAGQLASQVIVDPKNNMLRPIRAVAVTSDLSKEDRRVIYEQYDRGQIDVLTYVDMLDESWDSEAAKFLINLRPTASPLKATQRVGRILRPNDEVGLATVIEFIDISKKPQQTVFHVLGEDTFEPRRVYGRGQDSDNPNAQSDSERLGFAVLPEELQNLVSKLDHRLVREFVAEPFKYELPEGVVSIKDFARQQKIAFKSVVKILEEFGLETETFLFGASYRPGLGLTTAQQERILSHPFFELPIAGPDVTSFHALSVETGISRQALVRAADRLDLQLQRYRYGNNLAGYPGLNSEQRDTVLEHLRTSAPLADESITSLNSFIVRHHTSLPFVMAIVEDLGAEVGLFRLRNGVIVPGLTAELCEAVLGHRLLAFEEFTDEHIIVSRFIKELGIEKPRFADIAESLNIVPRLRRPRTSGKRLLSLTAEEAANVAEYVRENMPLPPDGAILLSEFSRECGIGMDKLRSIARELDIELPRFRYVRKGGGRLMPSVTPDIVAHIRSHPFFELTRASHDDVALATVARLIGSTSSTIIHVAEHHHIGIQSKVTPAGTSGQYISRDDLKILEGLPEFQILDADQTTIPYNALRAELKTDNPKLDRITEELGLIPKVYRFSGRKSKYTSRGFTTDESDRIRGHPSYKKTADGSRK